MNGQCSWTLDGVRCNKMLDGHDGPHSFTPQSQFRRTTVDAEQQEQEAAHAPQLSVADALMVAELPAGVRRAFMRQLRDAYYAGYDDAKRTAMEDELHGMTWLHVWQVRDAGCWAHLEAGAVELLRVENPTDVHEMYRLAKFRSKATTAPAVTPAASPVEDHP